MRSLINSKSWKIDGGQEQTGKMVEHVANVYCTKQGNNITHEIQYSMQNFYEVLYEKVKEIQIKCGKR